MGAFFYVIILILTWFLSSLFSMAGVGAANTLIPVYYSLGIPFSIAAASGLLLNVFSLTSATVNNGGHHHINWKLGTNFLIPAVIMAPIGAIVGVHTPGKTLSVIFVAFLLFTLYNLARTKRRRSEAVLQGWTGTAIAILIGCTAGFVGGLLGVGGGLIILPALTFLEDDYKMVSGTAGYVALFISASGFLSYVTILGGVSYVLWGTVLIGGILGGSTGSYLVNRFESRNIRYVIMTIVAIVTVKLIYSIIA